MSSWHSLKAVRPLTPVKFQAMVRQLARYEVEGVVSEFQIETGETYTLISFLPALGVQPSMIQLSGLNPASLSEVSNAD